MASLLALLGQARGKGHVAVVEDDEATAHATLDVAAHLLRRAGAASPELLHADGTEEEGARRAEAAGIRPGAVRPVCAAFGAPRRIEGGGAGGGTLVLSLNPLLLWAGAAEVCRALHRAAAGGLVVAVLHGDAGAVSDADRRTLGMVARTWLRLREPSAPGALVACSGTHRRRLKLAARDEEWARRKPGVLAAVRSERVGKEEEDDDEEEEAAVAVVEQHRLPFTARVTEQRHREAREAVVLPYERRRPESEAAPAGLLGMIHAATAATPAHLGGADDSGSDFVSDDDGDSDDGDLLL